MKLFKGVESKLQGMPDSMISTALIAIGTFGILVALRGPATAKLALLVWWLVP